MTAVAERYARSTRSSHLECTIYPGDIDSLIAAGLVRDGIGPGLMRLRSERDAISKLPGARLLSRALQSMASTRAKLTHFAIDRATKRGLELKDLEVQAIVERLIDLYLDPNCPTCNGTGKTGVYGAPQSMCSTCGGAMRRHLDWGRNQAIEDFAAHLTSQMESKVSTAERRIGNLLRDRE